MPNRETAIGQKRLPFCLSSSPDKQKTSSLKSPSALICANLRLSIFCLCLCALCVSSVRLFMSSLSVSICVHLRLIFPFRISIFHLQSSILGPRSGILGCILYCSLPAALCLSVTLCAMRFAFLLPSAYCLLSFSLIKCGPPRREGEPVWKGPPPGERSPRLL